MENLSSKTSELVKEFSKLNKLPDVEEFLIGASAQSPYLASQLNAFSERNLTLKLSKAGKGTSADATSIMIDPDVIKTYMRTEIGRKQFATLLAHELGHILSPGGRPDPITTPDAAVRSSHRAEGIALTSEFIVGF